MVLFEGWKSGLLVERKGLMMKWMIEWIYGCECPVDNENILDTFHRECGLFLMELTCFAEESKRTNRRKWMCG